jgi:hypothetical protein
MSVGFFWLWWLLTLCLCAWPLLRALENPRQALGFPVVASLMWLYFYVYLPFQAVTYLDDELEGLSVGLAQFLSCVCFACLLAGWYLGVRRAGPPLPPPPTYNLGRLWLVGLAWMVVGTAGMYSFAASGQAFKASSAYWYLLFNVGFAGIALCVAVLVLAPRKADPLSLLLFLGLTGALLYPFALGARRGPVFAAIIAAVFSYLLVRRTFPRLYVILGTLAFTGFLMLAFVEARNYTYRGQSWEDALENMTFDDIMTKRTRRSGDNEFVNHCIQVEANLETEQYQFGTAHLLVWLNWIPRALWPTKPPRAAGLWPEARDIFRPDHTFTNLGLGGAWGAVSDTFNNYWYFCFLFWFAIGWFVAAVFRRWQRGDLRWKMYYLGLLMSAHWFIAQCLPEALVPCLFYQFVFWSSFAVCRVRAPGRRLGEAALWGGPGPHGARQRAALAAGPPAANGSPDVFFGGGTRRP